MKGEINNNTIIVGYLNTPLTPMDISAKQKINKETQTLNDTMDQLHLIDICKTFNHKTMNFTFFSNAQGSFSSIDHILGHKSSLGKLKKTEFIPSISRAQCSKIKCQLQEEKYYKFQHMEAEQHTSD